LGPSNKSLKGLTSIQGSLRRLGKTDLFYVLTGITQYVTMSGYYQSFILGEAGDDLSAISLVDPSAHPSSERNYVQRKEYIYYTEREAGFY